ncbi:MAG: Rrf2 family transcriptional regulator [Planctomycetota bacterium]
MQLSKFSDYALRMLMYCGLYPNEMHSVASIAAAYGVSQHHLVKVAQRLQELRLVVATRGRGGGISLAKEPADVVVGEVVRATENLDVVECMSSSSGAAISSSCGLTGSCQLQHALMRARDAFLGELDVVTLADLLQPRAALLRRLPTSKGIAET